MRVCPSARFDTHRLLSALGSPEQISRRCRELGLTAPADSTVRMWRHRDSIPTAWIPTLLLVLPEDTNLRFFVERDSAPAADPFA